MIGERSVTGEYVPGRGFYIVFAVSLVAALLSGFYVASRSEWEDAAWSVVLFWLVGTTTAGLVIPDLAQHAVLRRFGARPRRVGWIERQNRLLFAWWEAPDHPFTRMQFAISHGVPVLLSCAVLLAYVVRFPTAAPILGLVLPFYLGNFWCALLLLRKPAGTLVQTLDRGVRFHEPAARVSSPRPPRGPSGGGPYLIG